MIDRISPLLQEKNWEVLRLVEPLLKPFMTAQKLLEASKEVTVSLVIPYIADLRDDLDNAVDLLNGQSCPPGSVVAEAQKDVLLYAEALQIDLRRRWGDGKKVLVYKDGPRRQLCGFKEEQVLATALDPRSKSLYEIEEEEHPDVWEAVAKEALKVAMETKAAEGTQSTSASSSPIAVEAPPPPLSLSLRVAVDSQQLPRLTGPRSTVPSRATRDHRSSWRASSTGRWSLPRTRRG